MFSCIFHSENILAAWTSFLQTRVDNQQLQPLLPLIVLLPYFYRSIPKGIEYWSTNFRNQLKKCLFSISEKRNNFLEVRRYTILLTWALRRNWVELCSVCKICTQSFEKKSLFTWFFMQQCWPLMFCWRCFIFYGENTSNTSNCCGAYDKLWLFNR